MQKVIITKGLPGSGKSYWAKKYVQKYPGFKRINNDEMRMMFHNNDYGSKGQEKFITKTRNILIENILTNGFSLIIDNTNLNPKRINQIEEFVKQTKKDVVIEIKDFTDVPLKDCIKNDLKRFDSVGKDVIMQMYNQFLKTETKPLEQDKGLPRAIICDLDGTLAILNGRDPYNASTCYEDEINEVVEGIVNKYRDKNHTIIFCTGRPEQYRESTMKFLEKCEYAYKCDGYDKIHLQPGFRLFMRKDEDYRKDAIIKKEIFMNNIMNKYYVEFCLDDRNQVVDGWRELGLTCLQVAPGDF